MILAGFEAAAATETRHERKREERREKEIIRVEALSKHRELFIWGLRHRGR